MSIVIWVTITITTMSYYDNMTSSRYKNVIAKPMLQSPEGIHGIFVDI